MPTFIDSDFGPIDLDKMEATGVSEGVAIFNPALKGKTIPGEGVCIVLAMKEAQLMVVLDDGRLAWKSASEVQLDWRYDFAKEQWVDGNGESLETGE